MELTRKVTMSFNNGEYMFSLYVTPKNIRVTRPQNTKKYISIEGKELNLSAGEGLRRVTINTFLPRSADWYISNAEFYEPDEIIRLLKTWQDSRKPMRLVISGTDINEAFLIEDFAEIFHEGDGDVEILLSLVQYRFVTALIVASADSDKLYEREVTENVGSMTHVVRKGDTLWAISKTYYGTPYRWSEIKEKNNIADVRKLQIGTVLKI